MRPRINENLYPLLVTIGVFIAILVGGGITNGYGRGNFVSPANMVDLFRNNAIVGVAAIGATLVILSGGIDLSVGAVVACAGVATASLVKINDLHPLTAGLIVVACGCVYGLISGFIIHHFNQPAFLITLAGMFFVRSIGFVISSESISISENPFHVWFSSEGATRLISLIAPIKWMFSDHALLATKGVRISVNAFVMMACFAISVIVLHLTAFGRDIYAVGGDEASAKLMGVRVGKTKMLIYTVAGGLSALAGALAVFDGGSGNPASYVGLELDVIAAVVVGGTLLTGGRGYVVGSLVGVLIIASIRALVTFRSLNSWWAPICFAVLMLLFIVTQKLLTRLGSERA